MFRGSQAVELADKGEPRPWHSTGEPALDPGQRQTGARRQPQIAHSPSHERGGFDLVEARLGVAQDRLAEIDDSIGMAVDRLANRALQLFLGTHFKPLLLVVGTLSRYPQRR